ncbi:MAG: reverse transcriptase/maturase family protein [Planctomycetota bacterium]
MKRAGNLFPKIIEWNNLVYALWRAAKGKRTRNEVVQFMQNSNQRLLNLQTDLIQGNFPIGNFRQFPIRDPKPRLITAPCFTERVVHHAIHNICESVFENFLIDQTYACRVGKGRVSAIEKAYRFIRKYQWYLKLDIRSFFDSISHLHLIERLERRFKDKELLSLFWRIIDSFSASPSKGLPIGALTSQHFANFFLGWMDHFIKHTLRCKGYVRYMDDFVLWSDDRTVLVDWHVEVKRWLRENLALELKNMSQPQKSRSGVNFLGCQIFPGFVALNQRNRKRISRRIRRLNSQVVVSEFESRRRQEKLTALMNFSRHGTTVPLNW